MESLWRQCRDYQQREARPALRGDITTDVLVIGGGMAGVLTAFRLQQASVPCVLVEGQTIGSGTTQNTTAKITAQHGLIYADIEKRRGLGYATQYLAANMAAVQEFRLLATQYPCDLEEKTAYVFSTDRRDKLEREAAVYAKLGLAADLRDSAAIPFSNVGALAMAGQAQFHPLKLLSALAGTLNLYENTFVRELAGGVALTQGGTIRAKHIVLATHFPLVNISGLYFIKLYQHRSYVLALQGAPLPEGMFLDEKENGISLRGQGDYLLIGGGDHKTGKPGGGLMQLRTAAKLAYPQGKERFHWAAQDCMTLDAVPYIGRHGVAGHHRAGEGQLYVATGFQKWGMTGSMVASRLLCDLIVHGKSELESLYAPQRSMFTAQLAVNAASAATGLLSIGSPRCTHMGCKLHKNQEEGTWDCPCHGSRFTQQGQVLENPAKRGLHESKCHPSKQ